jgi:hypothetical protein
MSSISRMQLTTCSQSVINKKHVISAQVDTFDSKAQMLAFSWHSCKKDEGSRQGLLHALQI